MDIKEYSYILAVVECGSISKAAKKLYISQPSLTTYINLHDPSLRTPYLFLISIIFLWKARANLSLRPKANFMWAMRNRS